MSSDEGLAATADHAVRSKVAAVGEGYWCDDFVGSFSLGRLDGSPGPLINRGQYARVAAISSAVEQFLLACAAAGREGQAAQLGLSHLEEPLPPIMKADWNHARFPITGKALPTATKVTRCNYSF